MITFIDTHRAEYAVESICEQWPLGRSTHYEHRCRQAGAAVRPPRVQRDAELSGSIRSTNSRLRGARAKAWCSSCQMGLDKARLLHGLLPSCRAAVVDRRGARWLGRHGFDRQPHNRCRINAKLLREGFQWHGSATSRMAAGGAGVASSATTCAGALTPVSRGG